VRESGLIVSVAVIVAAGVNSDGRPSSARPSSRTARTQWRQVADQLRPKVAKRAALMDEAEADVLAFMGFPKDHRAKIHSINLLERRLRARDSPIGLRPTVSAAGFRGRSSDGEFLHTFTRQATLRGSAGNLGRVTSPVDAGGPPTALGRKSRSLMDADSPGILVVDDNDDDRYMLQLLLEAEGHSRITIATGGHEALALLEREKFSLILLDMMMPGMTGDEVLKIIKKNPDTRDTPVVVLSADSDSEKISKCINIGADDYLPKPFNSAILRDDTILHGGTANHRTILISTLSLPAVGLLTCRFIRFEVPPRFRRFRRCGRTVFYGPVILYLTQRTTGVRNGYVSVWTKTQASCDILHQTSA
jgi:CheY-like chemotaxis protein